MPSHSKRLSFAILAAWLLLIGCDRVDYALPPRQAGSFEDQRRLMVEDQIRPRGVRHEGVLRAMLEVPRHEFVPEAIRSRAYDDSPLPIGLDQTISQPLIVAMMTELVEPKANHRVLEVGTGSGYQAAVIARLVSEVYTIEIIPELARSAAERLRRLGVNNVQVREGDGYLGWPEKAPFDGILVTAGATEIPQPLIDQLKPGARMVIPVGSGPFDQFLKVIQKQPNGKIEVRDILPVRFVPLRRK